MNPPTLDIATILQNNSIGVLGTDLFYDKEPEKPDDCITIYAYDSTPTGGFTCIEPEIYRLQIRVRSKVHYDGWNNMQNIITLINRQTFTLTLSDGDTTYKINIVSLPLNLQQDTKNRHISVVNISIIRFLATT